MNSKSIWSDMIILHSRAEHTNQLIETGKKAETVYKELSCHLATIPSMSPSKIEVLIPLFEKFDNINSEMDRTLLNLYIYINFIRIKHLGCTLQTDHMDKISTLLNMLNDQRRSLTTSDHSNFFEHLTDHKDKVIDNYLPYLALQEKATFKKLLNGLMGINMIVDFVTKHLDRCNNVLDHLDIKIEEGMNLYM